MPSRLATTLCGIPLKNPVLAASGTYAYGVEFADLVDLSALGGIVTKGLSREPIAGNPPSLIDVPPGCAFYPRCPYVGQNGDRCFSEVPHLTPFAGDPGHRVACHLPQGERRAIFEREVMGVGAAP